MNGPKTGRSGVRIVSGEELIRCCNKRAKKRKRRSKRLREELDTHTNYI